MPTLLHIDSSPLYGHSVSRQLTSAFVDQWKSSHPDGTLIERDLTSTFIPPINAAWVGAVYTPEDSRTAEQKETLTLSDSLLAELFDADEYVIGVPMHNFSVPSVLKLWIDQIARVNKTFSYADGTPKGLLTGKKATLVIASGGIYDAGTQFASYDHVEPYLRAVFGFLGVAKITVITAGGASALMRGADRATFLAPHLEAVQAHAQVQAQIV
ncbi:FMN-dependent NADH-azoreductase [Granulicella aggregans]|uniref:FMN dependent NADH:quinone oxidoreductase n=1 Tax=Granulicella aggregans TaxID=474949 RepID=A0A7W7ZE19_9BACT|nr:NAD(P)H-dependent oxidoreductase [Granulicella aggregans]MBB5058191.1 FMN-dependent NADH-azoreductase [Granulicella aggregans]